MTNEEGVIRKKKRGRLRSSQNKIQLLFVNKINKLMLATLFTTLIIAFFVNSHNPPATCGLHLARKFT